MKTLILSLSFIVLLNNIAFPQGINNVIPVEYGVSLQLANFRHSVISDVQYILNFDIPADKNKTIQAAEKVGFNWTPNQQVLQIDFKQSKEHLQSMTVNGKITEIKLQDEHVLVDPALLTKGHNEVSFNFIAGDGPLNRDSDFMYGLFVPDRARTCYPCFDQPDLKAKFLLTLKIPREWKVLANAAKRDSVVEHNAITFHFAQSDLLPTYLFSFAAGKFSATSQNVGTMNAEFLYRETDTTKIKLSVDSIFAAHKHAIRFLEQWTGIPFPFQKAGFVAIPYFQYGGMEHPGEVEYNAAELFLDKGATKDQLITRLNIISHETSHMWFGDMVTIKWFNDVWMKEVFANFIADKVTEKVMGTETYKLRFLQEHYPYAYSVNRTSGANPIRQKLTNLQDAGTLYGDIIYEKAPIVMRQLEGLIGKENFRQGVDEYLKKYAWKNADWNDLISILKTRTTKNLDLWNQVWVNQPGRPVLNYVERDQNGVIKKFLINQHAESGAPGNWPQRFELTFIYPHYRKSFPVNISNQTQELTTVKGLKKPAYIIFNSDGAGYGVFPIDKKAGKILYSLNDPLERSSIYINAYENMLSGKAFIHRDLLLTYLKGIQVEKDEMTLRLLCNYIKSIYWKFITPPARSALSEQVENTIWQAMANQQAPNNKLILFKAYQDVYTSAQAGNRIYEIWKNKQAPAGVTLELDDFISLALTIALKTDQGIAVIQEQRDRMTDKDRKARLDFLIQSFSPDEKVRDAFFDSLADLKNRKKEPWVTTALTYLNHPLRQPGSMKYLPKTLEMLEEIQKTGGVFFPQDWLNAAFGYYQDKAAYQYVQVFLQQHPDYDPNLKEKILQATDNLYRAQNGLVR